jgi:hypothetical protein
MRIALIALVLAGCGIESRQRAAAFVRGMNDYNLRQPVIVQQQAAPTSCYTSCAQLPAGPRCQTICQ